MEVSTGKLPLGRPRLRWLEQVNKDLSRIGGIVQMAEDRITWKGLVHEAKDLTEICSASAVTK